MNFIEFFTSMASYLSFNNWRDPVECLLIIGFVYGVLKWLERDPSKILLASLYSWCFFYVSASLLHFEIIIMLMLVTLPLALFCMLLFHPEKLQKSFVLYKAATIAQSPIDWVTHLMRSFLAATNKNQEVIVFIERSDSLATAFTIRQPLHAPLSNTLMNMIQETTPLEDPCVLCISQQGIIHGMELMKRESITWIELALVMSSRNDCMMIKNNPATRLYEIVIQGKHLIDLNADHALRMLRKTVLSTSNNEISYEFTHYQTEQQSSLH